MNKKYYIIASIVLLTIFASVFLFLTKKDKEIKHIFLITIDTLRADHLSCYGYPVKTTPFIDSLARKGVLFKNAFSQSATTCPSHASIMTGLYPSQHRVVANGYILDDSYTTLAEILTKNGFKTAAFTSTDRHFLASNINQGFDMYEEPLNTTKVFGYKYRPARLNVNNAILWLDNFNPKNKLFMWVHLFDPHFPYHPPEKYKKIIKKQLSKEYLKNYVRKAKINLEIFNNSFDEYYEYILNYDSEIRYVDNELKRFYSFLKVKGLEKNSLIIITADHGEALGQHNWLQHASKIYQEEIHVPLIFYFGDIKLKNSLKNSVIYDYVENFDIFGTIIDFANIKNNKNYLNKVASISLKKRLFNKKFLIKKFVFTERQYYKKNKFFKKDIPFWKRIYEKGIKVSLIKNGFKYIYRSVYKDEFYDLNKDPLELRNLAKNKITTKYRYRKQIFYILSKFKNKVVKRASRKIFRRLKSLGYVE